MTRKPLRSKPSFNPTPRSLDVVIDKQAPAGADVTPDPPPPLDDAPVPPLTNPDDVEGG